MTTLLIQRWRKGESTGIVWSVARSSCQGTSNAPSDTLISTTCPATHLSVISAQNHSLPKVI